MSGGQAGAAIMLQVGGEVVPLSPGSGAALQAAIEAANAKVRLPAVPDTLNPAVIDPAKAERFVAGLPGQSREVLGQLEGHTLRLNGTALGVGAAEPTHAEDFGAYKLLIEGVRGDTVTARTSVAPDPALAKARAGQAEQALRAAEREVKQIEEAHTGGHALGEARQRRATLARAWRINAGAWAKAAPGDAAAQEAAEASRKAGQQYMMPSGGLI